MYQVSDKIAFKMLELVDLAPIVSDFKVCSFFLFFFVLYSIFSVVGFIYF